MFLAEVRFQSFWRQALTFQKQGRRDGRAAWTHKAPKVAKAACAARGGRARALLSHWGQGTVPGGAPASPEEEGRQPWGHFTTQQEAVPPAAETSWQKLGRASS